MSKMLILVESPSKAKTINKYVGKSYVVEATVGHVRNLPKTKLGIDLENGFTPSLVNIRGKGDLIKKIRSLAAKTNKIYIATDPDREGEAIAQDVVDILDPKHYEKIERVLFNEITKTAVNKAIKNPIKIDEHLVISQRARRVMDRIIGYKVSPFLWRAVLDSYGSSLSAGRVQSVALRLICEREDEIEKFISTEYWSIVAVFKTEKGEEFVSKLFEVDGKTIKVPPKPIMTDEDWNEFFLTNFAITKDDLANKIVEELKTKQFVISDITKKENRKNPYPPFITSSLQIEASRKLRFRPRRTMMVAQSLYEGVDLGSEGTTGLITYMRTDSTRLSDDIVNEARQFISDKYGPNYIPESAKSYDQKNKKNVQDAHEAIRPTSLKYTPDFVKEYLDEPQFKVYELIWKRFIACQMESARLETTTVSIAADKYIFRSTGSAMLFDGFLTLYDESTEDTTETNGNDGRIPAGLEKDQILSLEKLTPNQHFTKPPARFSESTLIKELEANGIGRPSTYAMIMGTIIDRNYVEQQERKLFPTPLGRKVNGILVLNFPNIFNVNFTAQMEGELDLIADGEIDYLKVLNDFYTPFAEALKNVEANLEKIICEKCGSEMDLKIGRFGKYIACTNYPECKNIKSLKEISGNTEPDYTGEECPKCNSKTVYRDSKFGRFIGCEKYPDCDFTKVITLGLKCPKCAEGEVITRRTKRGKIFYGCNKYPDCDFASWTMPKPKEEDEEPEVASSEEEY